MEAVPDISPKQETDPERLAMMKEYTTQCAQLGEWGYKAHLLQMDIDQAIENLKKLSQEFNVLKDRQEKQPQPPKETA